MRAAWPVRVLWPARVLWPVRSVAAGAAGTAVLTLAYVTEHRLRGSRRSVDYDDSLVPGQIVCSVLRLEHVSDREEDEIGLALRWSYGSAFGIAHGLLRRRLPEPRATVMFGAALLTLTLTMFPLLGKTPPPWRWPNGYLGTAFLTHAAYAVTVAYVDDRLRAG